MIVHLTATREEFAAQRRRAQDELIEALLPVVQAALVPLADGDEQWADALMDAVTTAYEEAYRAEGGEASPQPAAFRESLQKMLDATTPQSRAENIAVALAIAVINAASIQAAQDDPEELFLEWVTMHDDAVRTAHRLTDGQQRPIGEKFNVDGTPMTMPGDVSAPIELWINCRCTLRPVLASEALTASTGGTMNDTSVPWHGVWAPEGVWSGDKRKFKEGALSHRPLPLPLTWQKVSDDGHRGNVVVAMAEDLQMIDGMMHASGHFISNAEADEVIGLLGEFGRFGVSVDADDATFELDEEEEGIVFTRARVSSACIVPIPAFAEAWVALGQAPWMKPKKEDEEGEPEGRDEVADSPEAIKDDAPPLPDDEEEPKKKKVPFREVDSAERDRLKDEGKAMPDGSFPIANTDDLRNAIQAIGRAKDPAAAKAHIKRRAKALGAEGMIPDSWSLLSAVQQMRSRVEASDWSDIEKFADVAPGRTEDGPGWLTHPVDTDRLRDYWVRGPGAAKIAWGSPGDFNRCRANVAEYVKPQHLNGYCANRHYDALGTWPGRGAHAAESLEFTEPAEALSLVASAGIKAPAAYFANPNLEQITPLTVTDEGRVFGHLATWNSCHIGFKDMCVAPPNSASDYSYFHTGSVLLDSGETVPVGNITIGGGHADTRLGMRAAMEHYDSTSAVVADICVGEDAFGIWFSGWVRPGVSDEMVYALRASALSGDWRSLPGRQGDLELIAALAVNVPGFGIPRTQVAASSEGQVSLVASGIVSPAEESVEQNPAFDQEAFADAIVSRIMEVQRNKERMAALAARLNGEGGAV